MVRYMRPSPPDWRRWSRTKQFVHRRGPRHETIHAGVEPELTEAFKHTARSSILKRSGQTGSDHTDLVLLHGFFPACCSSPGLSPSPKNDRVRTGHRIPSHVNPCRRQPWNHMPTSNIKSSTYTGCAKQKKSGSVYIRARTQTGRPPHSDTGKEQSTPHSHFGTPQNQPCRRMRRLPRKPRRLCERQGVLQNGVAGSCASALFRIAGIDFGAWAMQTRRMFQLHSKRAR
jgi:hypothetical protein